MFSFLPFCVIRAEGLPDTPRLFMGPSGDFNPSVYPVAYGTGARCAVRANEKCHVINIWRPYTIYRYLRSLLGSYGPPRALASIATNASSL
jgi:hypothetical protein